MNNSGAIDALVFDGRAADGKTIINCSTIDFTARSSGATQAYTLINSGTLSITNGLGDFNGSTSNDTVNNTGTINADLQGSLGDDTVTGVVDGGTGNDTLDGGAGDDLFIFTSGDGDDTVQNFESDDLEDIDLSGVSEITDFIDLVLNHLVNDGGTAVIDYGSGTIRLDGVAFSDVGSGLAYSDSDFLL